MKRLFFSLSLATAALFAPRADAAIAYAISDLGLIRFDTVTPGSVTVIGAFTGATTGLDGIDFRPSNGLLYGYDSTSNQIVTVDTATAVTTFVSTPATGSTAFTLGIDFNPVPDRLRVVNTVDQNLRINVANGATTVDGTLVYATGDPNEGRSPSIIEAAYTNSNVPSPRTPPPGTQLYYIDSDTDSLVTTAAPNDGILNTVGALGVNATFFTGFDIFTPSVGTNTAFAILGTSGSPSLYTINLGTGSATLVGNLDPRVTGVYSLAVAIVPEPASLALVSLPAALGLLALRRRRNRAVA